MVIETTIHRAQDRLVRLFFAIRPTPAVASSLATHAQRLANDFGGKATRAETIHLTLAFLGEQPQEQVALLQDAAASVSATPFVLTLNHIGHWRHNRLFWAGCAHDAPAHDALTRLALELRHAIVASGVRFAGETDAFTPHVTLVRRVPERAHRTPLPSLPPIIWPCCEFVLVHSQLTPNGPEHRTIATFPSAPLPATPASG